MRVNDETAFNQPTIDISKNETPKQKSKCILYSKGLSGLLMFDLAEIRVEFEDAFYVDHDYLKKLRLPMRSRGILYYSRLSNRESRREGSHRLLFASLFTTLAGLSISYASAMGSHRWPLTSSLPESSWLDVTDDVMTRNIRFGENRPFEYNTIQPIQM
jgi:hypothetical protein